MEEKTSYIALSRKEIELISISLVHPQNTLVGSNVPKNFIRTTPVYMVSTWEGGISWPTVQAL